MANRSLHGNLADGLLLGGLSAMVLVVLTMLKLEGHQVAILSALMVILANVVNHPHFAFSYQIFYALKGSAELQAAPKRYRVKWIFVAYVLPLVMASVLAAAIILWMLGSRVMMAGALSVMGALVGWHYVKQGFGILMLDAKLKGHFFESTARLIFLANSYACWMVALALVNLSDLGSAFWGVFRLKFSLPKEVLILALVLFFCTTLLSLFSLQRAFRAWRNRGDQWRDLPLNGLIAYLVTLYLWAIFVSVDPICIVVVPFFHSLQYMTVVVRCKLNEMDEAALKVSKNKLVLRYFFFSVLMGGLAFWVLPGVVDYFLTGQAPNFFQGTFLVTAAAWIFLNIHHYFMDSVIWRRENKIFLRLVVGD